MTPGTAASLPPRYMTGMNRILDHATDAIRSLSPDEQDEIAREIDSLTLEAQGFKPVPGGYAFRVSRL